MAQVLAINDVIRAQIICADNEQASFNTVHYQVTGVGVSTATLEDFCGNWSALVAPKVKPLIWNGASFNGVIGQVISPLPLMARFLEDADSGVGTAGAIGAPRQATGLIRFQTDFAGPGFRGRNYLPFVSTTSVQSYGTATNLYVANALVLSEAMRTFTAVSNAGRTATVRLGLFKRAGSVFTPVVSTSASPDFATQKRRGTFGRANNPPL